MNKHHTQNILESKDSSKGDDSSSKDSDSSKKEEGGEKSPSARMVVVMNSLMKTRSKAKGSGEQSR